MGFLKGLLKFGAGATLAASVFAYVTADHRKELEVEKQCTEQYVQMVENNSYTQLDYKSTCKPYFDILEKEINNLKNFEISLLSKSLPVQWEQISKQGIKSYDSDKLFLQSEYNEFQKLKNFSWDSLNSESPKKVNVILYNKFRHLQNIMISLTFELEYLELIYLPHFEELRKNNPEEFKNWESEYNKANEMVKSGHMVFAIYSEEISLKFRLWDLENPELTKHVKPEIKHFVNDTLSRVYFKAEQRDFKKDQIESMYKQTQNGKNIEQLFQPGFRGSLSGILKELK